MVEYLLLLALISIVAFGFSAFLSGSVIGGGLTDLPNNIESQGLMTNVTP